MELRGFCIWIIFVGVNGSLVSNCVCIKLWYYLTIYSRVQHQSHSQYLSLSVLIGTIFTPSHLKWYFPPNASHMFLLIFDTALPWLVIALASNACLRKVSGLDSCCTYQAERQKQWEKFAERMDLLLSGGKKGRHSLIATDVTFHKATRLFAVGLNGILKQTSRPIWNPRGQRKGHELQPWNTFTVLIDHVNKRHTSQMNFEDVRHRLHLV